MSLDYDNIRRLDDLFIYKQPFQTKIFERARVAEDEVYIISGITGKGFLSNV